MRLELLPAALAGLRSIADFIDNDDPARADRVIAELLRKA